VGIVELILATRWQKVLVDLWRNRTRTLIVALAIAVGVYAVGVVLNTREMVVREYASDQDGALIASAILYTTPFDDELARRVAEMPGVAAAEGRRVVRTQVDNNGQRRDLVLTSIPDFVQMQVDTLTPVTGKWPPGKREVILERLAMGYLGLALGQTVVVELEDGTQKELTVVGTAHDPQQLSPNVTNAAAGYVTPETMEALGLGPAYTELHIRLESQPRDEAHIQAIADQVEDRLERTGRPVLGRQIITESIADPFIDTIVLILSSFGLVILLLSGFLVVNAISALITQQVPQIGVMKLVGARRGQIMSLYLVTVLVYGLLAITLGIPAAIATARLLMLLLVEGVLNVKFDSLAVRPLLVAAQAAVGLLLPLLAGLVPVIQGTRITTHQALNGGGMQRGAYRQGGVERVLGALQRLFSLRRPVLLAMRNALRHRGRLLQTLVVLVFGTALFISVVSVWASVDATVEGFMRYHRYDVSIGLQRPYRLARLEPLARQVPGVVDVEGWSLDRATRQRPDGTESGSLAVYALPADSTFVAPQVSDGRWLSDQVRNGVVLNSDVVEEEGDLGVGDKITLEIGGREATWQVVGIVPTESRGPALYVALDDYAYHTRTAGQVTHLQVVAQEHGAAAQEQLAAQLFDHFEARGLEVSSTETSQVMREENKFIFSIIVAFLVLMALLLAAVGGLGLTTTMSINVLERVREIGVLRAIGASNLSVRGIVLAEGLAIGLVSWIAGALLSVPLGAALSEQLGLALIQVPLSYHYSTTAAAVWFFVLQAVAVAASLGPARNAVRLTIREVLAYE
jgi:putative ABC transport system permease protein